MQKGVKKIWMYTVLTCLFNLNFDLCNFVNKSPSSVIVVFGGIEIPLPISEPVRLIWILFPGEPVAKKHHSNEFNLLSFFINNSRTKKKFTRYRGSWTGTAAFAF